MKDNSQLSERLRQLRKNAGLSQEQLEIGRAHV